MNTSLFILFSSGPHVLPGQPSNKECTPWKKSTMEGGEDLKEKNMKKISSLDLQKT